MALKVLNGPKAALTAFSVGMKALTAFNREHRGVNGVLLSVKRR